MSRSFKLQFTTKTKGKRLSSEVKPPKSTLAFHTLHKMANMTEQNKLDIAGIDKKKMYFRR